MKIISNNIYYGFNKYDNATTNKINEKFERIKDPKNDIKFDINKNNKVEKSDKEENINIQNNNNNVNINKNANIFNIINDFNERYEQVEVFISSATVMKEVDTEHWMSKAQLDSPAMII